MAGFFSKISSRVRRFFGQKRSSTYREPMMDLLFQSGSGAAVSERTTVGISAVFQGLRFISSAIASMPRYVVEEDEQENLSYQRSHPIHRLLTIEAHPTCTPYDFFFALIWQTKLRGNGIAIIERNGRTQRPTGLKLVPWSKVVDIKEDEENKVITYKIQGYQERFYHYDIIHIKNATDDGICGLDTLKIHLDNFGLDLASRQTANHLYKNGAMVGGFLTTDKLLGPDSRSSMEKSWNLRYGGPENAGKTPLLEGGVKYERTALTPVEAGLNEARQFNVYEAARILGVSPHVLYALDRANFSNIETLHQEIGKYTLAPIVESIEQELRRKLFRKGEQDRMRVVFNMDAFTRGDTESRSTYIREMTQNGVFSINEARRMEGKNSVVWGNAFLIPKNMTLIDDQGNVLVNSDNDGQAQKDDEEATRESNKLWESTATQ